MYLNPRFLEKIAVQGKRLGTTLQSQQAPEHDATIVCRKHVSRESECIFEGSQKCRADGGAEFVRKHDSCCILVGAAQ